MYQERETAGAWTLVAYSFVCGVVSGTVVHVASLGLPLRFESLAVGGIVGLVVSPAVIAGMRGVEFGRPALAALSAAVAACSLLMAAGGGTGAGLVGFWVVLIGTGTMVGRRLRARESAEVGCCGECGQDLAGAPDRVCPECGRERVVVPAGAGGGVVVRRGDEVGSARAFALVAGAANEARRRKQGALAESLRGAMGAEKPLMRMREVLVGNRAAVAALVRAEELDRVLVYLESLRASGGVGRGVASGPGGPTTEGGGT